MKLPAKSILSWSKYQKDLCVKFFWKRITFMVIAMNYDLNLVEFWGLQKTYVTPNAKRNHVSG